MLAANSSLNVIKPFRNLGSGNVIRCFGSDVTNIIKIESKINLLASNGLGKGHILQQPTQSSLPKESIPGYSDLSLAENAYKPKILVNLMDQQEPYLCTHIPVQRSQLVSWMVLLHIKMRLGNDSLYLSISILNRCLPALMDVQNIDLDLVAITCVWIAAKIEEIKVPGLRHWVRFGRGFEQAEIVEMEQQILEKLQYKTIVPTPLSFLDMLQTLLQLQRDSRQLLLSLYIMELSQLGSHFLKYSASLLAISSLYLSYRILNIEWNNSITQKLALQIGMVRNCARELAACLQIDSKEKQSPVFRKYLTKKFGGISNICLGRKSQMIH